MLIVEDLKTHERRRIATRYQSNWRAQPGTIVMKFGEQLRSSIIREYQWYYIDYDSLKADLKNATGELIQPDTDDAKPNKKNVGKRAWTEEDERRFCGKLDDELDKVHQKQQVKLIEIKRRIQVTERDVKDVVNRLRERGTGGEGPSEEEFIMLEEDLSDIIADIHDLSKFCRLNYTGFHKIVKKHDKVTGLGLRSIWESQMKAKPFYKEDYDPSVVKLSGLYEEVKTRGNPTQGDSAAGGGQANFVRQTTKYWVHPDNITELKLALAEHMPVLVFNKEKEVTPETSSITSIYYDNPETWDLYKARLMKLEGGEAIRLRWYGGMSQETVWVERKTHREDWTGEESVKARFSIKEKYVNAYMKGEYLPAAIFEKARQEGKKSMQAIDEDERLAAEVQWSVIKKGYVPVCRSFYHRTAFQLPGDARVRVSLDTELTMVREDNLGGRQRSGDNWRRMDIGVDFPFSQLPPEDVERFPYAVLEVKLQTQAGQEAPEWIRKIISSHLVEAVPKFSKFIHGTATLFPEHIKLLPFWMPQMDTDILKPRSHDFGIRRSLNNTGTNATSDDDDSASDSDDDKLSPASRSRRSHTNGESSRAALPLSLTDAEDQTTNQIWDLGETPYDSDDESDDDKIEEAKRVGGITYATTLASVYANKVGRGLLNATTRVVAPLRGASEIPRSDRLQMLYGNEQLTDKRFKAPKGKKIYVPVRVEPKVYLAAERTFLGWLEYSIYIGVIATTLLNFSSGRSDRAFLVAGMFTFVAMLSLVYSTVIYFYRSKAIRTRRSSAKYYDRWGPTALCATLFIAVVVNFVFEGIERGML